MNRPLNESSSKSVLLQIGSSFKIGLFHKWVVPPEMGRHLPWIFHLIWICPLKKICPLKGGFPLKWGCPPEWVFPPDFGCPPVCAWLSSIMWFPNSLGLSSSMGLSSSIKLSEKICFGCRMGCYPDCNFQRQRPIPHSLYLLEFFWNVNCSTKNNQNILV